MKSTDLESLGHAAGLYQRDPREIASALVVVQAEAALAVGEPIPHTPKPVLRLNDVPYFDADEVAGAVAALALSDAKRTRREAAADE